MATSHLQKKMTKKIRRILSMEVIENTRPIWLAGADGTRLELDIYIPAINCAIEVQGQQHVCFTPYFHKDIADFESQVARDQEKLQLCKRSGVELFYVFSNDDVETVAYSIYEISKKSTSALSVTYTVYGNENNAEICKQEKYLREVLYGSGCRFLSVKKVNKAISDLEKQKNKCHRKLIMDAKRLLRLI